jgi:DegV family protein with EDD domain
MRNQGNIMVRIITDSATDFPSNLALEYRVKIIPARIWFGQEQYIPGKNLTTVEFYEKLQSEKSFPRTIPASPKDFYEVFVESKEPTLVILISRQLSNFYECASLAKARFNLDHITIYDSGSISMGAGLMVYIAGHMARLGYSIKDIIAQLDKIKDKTAVYGAAYSLKYLVASGRIPAYKGYMGGILNKKPIIMVKNGVTTPLASVKGFDQAVKRLIEAIKQSYPAGSSVFVSVLNAGNEESAGIVTDNIYSNYQVVRMIDAKLGSAVGANLGPKSIGVAITPAVKF